MKGHIWHTILIFLEPKHIIYGKRLGHFRIREAGEILFMRWAEPFPIQNLIFRVFCTMVTYKKFLLLSLEPCEPLEHLGSSVFDFTLIHKFHLRTSFIVKDLSSLGSVRVELEWTIRSNITVRLKC